jgi:hypothetical protein
MQLQTVELYNVSHETQENAKCQNVTMRTWNNINEHYTNSNKIEHNTREHTQHKRTHTTHNTIQSNRTQYTTQYKAIEHNTKQ